MDNRSLVDSFTENGCIEINLFLYFINMTKQWILDELRSFITTFIATMGIEATFSLIALYNGDFSHITILALGTAAFRSLIKTILTLIFPTIFPARISQQKSNSVDAQNSQP